MQALRQIAGLTAIEKLIVSNSDLSDDAMDHLAKLPRLTSLELRGVDISDAGLAKIAKLTTLRELNLNHARFTDKGLAHSEGLAEPRAAVPLVRTRTADAGVGIPRRDQDAASGPARLHDGDRQGNRSVEGAARDRRDHARQPDITDKGAEALGSMPTLKISRSLPHAHLREGLDKAQSGAAELPRSYGTKTRRSHAKASVMPALSRRGLLLFPFASVLRARNDAEWIRRLGGRVERDAAGEVVAIHLANTWINDTEMLELPAYEKLQRLDLSHTRISDEGLLRIRPAKNIRDLDLFYAEQITDLGLTAIKGWRNLKKLNVRGTRIADDTLEIVGELRQIEWLDIANTAVTDNGLDSLAAAHQPQAPRARAAAG